MLSAFQFKFRSLERPGQTKCVLSLSSVRKGWTLFLLQNLKWTIFALKYIYLDLSFLSPKQMGRPKQLICAYFTEHRYFDTHTLRMLWVHNFWKLHVLSGIILSVVGFILNNTIKQRWWCMLTLPTLSKFTANRVRVSDVLSRWECFNQPNFFFSCSLCSLRTGDFMALLCCMMCTVITYAKSMSLMNEHWVCVSSRWELPFDLRSTTVADGCLNCFINALKSSIIS